MPHSKCQQGHYRLVKGTEIPKTGRVKAVLPFFLIFASLLTGEEKPPNLVYINADDLGWTDLSSQGSRYYETPNIDQLAASGMVFTNGYAAASNCAPSRACAMSGQWTPRHGVYTVSPSTRGKAKDRKLIPTPNNKTLADEVLTLPEVLQAAGYFTAHVGKWHLSEDPLDHGFEVNLGGFHGGAPGRGGYHSPYNYPNVVNKKKGEYLTDRLAEEACRIISENKDRPFFLSFTTYSVHTPIQGREDLVKKFAAKESTAEHNNAEYAAMIASLDMAVGRVVETLKEHQLLERTLIIFTSDNGGHEGVTSNEPLRSGKGSYYEGGIREPFFFSWKGKIKAGQSSDTPMTNLDLFPTLVAAARAPLPKTKLLDGHNLLPLLTKGQPLSERPLYWHFPIYLEGYRENDQETRDPLFRTRPGSVVRLGPWKLHQYFEDNGLELYNLDEDLSEQTNLANTKPEKVKELLALLENWRKETNAPVPTELNPKFRTPETH